MADKYIWDNWLPKLASKDRVMTDVDFATGSTTPFSDMLGFACLSDSSSKTELMTDKGPILSAQMGWDLLNNDLGEGRVELMTAEPTPLSSRMGWALLSDRQHYGVAETAK